MNWEEYTRVYDEIFCHTETRVGEATYSGVIIKIRVLQEVKA